MQACRRGRPQTVAVMLGRAAETFVEGHFGCVAEVLVRLGDRGGRVAYVARAWGLVLRLELDAHDVRDTSPQVTNAGCRAAPDVEDFAGDLFGGRVTREQIRVHDVRHVGEVPRLLAVSEDDRC